ncbi:hypothetical protein ACIRYZ_39015 [Kitasatospora sp. NPDC101155]|uniref:hypothetical protein n=1 Tax=Kitasatospora sp. NPDC101155 TaxID=3364097 RepID=UPI0037FC69E3
MYDEIAPSEAQLRAALAALSLPIPPQIEHPDEGERKAALAAHLLRAATRATHNLVNATDRIGEAGHRAEAAFPHGWPVDEDHWTVAHLELAFPADRMGLLLEDQHAQRAVSMDDPDSDMGDDGGIDQVEAHAEGAWAAIEAAGALIELRLGPANPHLAEASLDLISDRIDRLLAAYQTLARHHGLRTEK